MNRVVPAALTALTALGWCAPSVAQVAASPHPAIEADLQGYYGGERLSAYVIGGVGLTAAGVGAYLVTRDADLARGLGVAWVSMGTLEFVGAIFYAVQVGAEIRHYTSVLARDPRAFQSEEVAHMHGTSDRFFYYRAVELTLTVTGAGLATYGLAASRDTFTGVGLGVASLALPFLLIDTVNDARATRYLHAVEGVVPAVSTRSLTGDRALTLALTGRF